MKNEHGQEHILEYDQINDPVYIGTNMCCQKHFEQELLDKGITSDISLEEEHLDMPQGVETFHWLPVKDHSAPTLDQLHLGVKILQTLISMNKKVYVHCKNGHGRAPTLVAAYFILQGKTAKDAILFVKEKRKSIHLEKEQIRILETFEKIYRKTA